ncbi:trypsin-like peptidase domain-containing protein [Sporosarcina thermotolerans]|uniref:Trypsin-like peptidase domain-containing protein n=1 Tax=Sporosarcina thermotolerans TaxID=633404 RepID=A0AAW9A957_9BACL|nr:trypsin-like peptidase domain-containing protein [Sporosarcina thermotolerans]MDW0116704.1 trypsin-like peptidase domain-containing protein [Sporosarcina thermotolerans]WHT48896.1 trypsin-like peptidase domain-containing protein [Sporosarcina thermotolerans]
MENSFIKRFISTVGAGVLGSALTLGVVANTDLLQAKMPQEKTAAVTENSSTTTNIIPTSTYSGSTLSDMVEYASKGIVGVSNFKTNGNRFAGNSELSEFGTGSGVIYKIDGNDAYVVTNNHVIEGAGKIEVTLEGGEKETAELIGSDALTDLAVLKISASNVDTALEFGDSGKLRAGDTVVAIGNPLSLDFSGTVTQGIISAPSRSIEVKTTAGNWEMDVIQTDAAINPGNSGGALISADGKVIGINSLKIAESGVEGLGFAIPSNDVVPLLEEITKNGKIERPYIGISLADLANVPYMYVQNIPQEVKGGVMITSVDPTSAAGKAGLKEQDVITAINGTDIMNSMELRKFLYSELSIGDKAQLTVYTGAEKRTVELTLTGKTPIE